MARNLDGGEKRSSSQWTQFTTAWGRIDSKGGAEFFRAKAVNADLTHEITIRWQPGITPKMRVLFQDPNDGSDRYFDIQSIPNPNNQIAYILLLHCRELLGREARS